MSRREKLLDQIELLAMCDITNPLTGPEGAAHVFSPQKGADEGMIQDVNVFSDAMDQEMIGMLAEQLKGCAYAEEDICREVKAVGTDAFQAGEYTGADEPQSCRIKEDIMTLVRESL